MKDMKKAITVRHKREVKNLHSYSVQGVRLSEKVSFSVMAESVEDLLRFLVYNEMDLHMNIIYTSYTHINGRKITREQVELACRDLKEYKGFSKDVVELIATEVFNSVY